MFSASTKSGKNSGSTPDPQFNYVAMLLHGDGTNGAQNNTFLDSSTNNFSITRNGNTTQGSFSPYGSNWSNFFTSSSGVGAYLTTPNSSAMQLGSGNFTIECWVFLAKVAENAFIGRSPFDNTNNEWVFQSGPSNNIRFAYSTNGSDSQTVLESTTNIPISTWTHVAVVRNSSTLTFYINGTSVGSSSISATIYSGNTTTTIGSYAQSAYPTGYAVPNGYLSNIRLVKGTAVYTSNFTPSTTPLTAISGTSMLTCQSNRFLDNSSNNFTFTTVNGTPSVQRFNPFGASTAYSTSVIGGSGYFDGNGDSLSTTWSPIGANQFTCETWVYVPDNTGRYYIVGPGTDTASHFDGFGFEIFDRYLSMWASSDGTSWNLVTSDTSQGRSANLIPQNSWVHVAMTRDSSGVFRSFINGNLQCVVSSGTAALADSSTTVLNVGRARYTGNFANFNGFMGNLRIVNGSVVSSYSTSSTTVGTQIFTPPTAPLTAITNTSLLINYTNGAIYDNAMMNNLETVGNAQISTSVVKYGTGSMYFDGSTSYLKTADSVNFELGNASWTIEAWIYPTSTGLYPVIAAQYGAGSGNNSFFFSLGPNNTNLELYLYSTASNPSITATNAITLNTWQHVAAVRNGNTVTLYVNGISVGTPLTFGTSINSTYPLTVGWASSSEEYPFFGYIDDFRFTKGYARYTANFTPPTAAFSNTGPY